MGRVLLEVCVDGPEGLVAAVAGGADRIELCAALELGGLTPSAGLMRMAAGAGVPALALIRPRAGDFVFSAAEAEAMLGDIAAARAAGLAGVVLGASLADGRLDADLLARLVGAAAGMDLTLHRAFDLVPDVGEAVGQAVALGFRRILTSGGAVRAVDGVERLRATVAAARGRIGVMPGAGIDAGNVAGLLAAVPVGEIHASCSGPVAVAAQAVDLGFAPAKRRVTSADRVRALRAALDAAA